MKIVLCGPPHSGKSCLRFGLKEAIKSVSRSLYPFVITACPDGEGSWFQETTRDNPNLATILKAAYKRNFTEELVKIMAEWVKTCVSPLLLVDIGEIPDTKNENICAYATHAILLAGDLDRLLEWREFCSKMKLQIVAEIHSDYNGTLDKSLVVGNDGIYRGSVHYLERGDLSIQQRPTVIELANLLMCMATEKER